MSGTPTEKLSRSEQCRLNAHNKSAMKVQKAMEAIETLKKSHKPVTVSDVASLAGVSRPFIRAHQGIKLAITAAQKRNPSEINKERNISDQRQATMISALQRDLKAQKDIVKQQDETIRTQKELISKLYGKLAAN